MRLFVCYVPGLDRRLVGPAATPFVHRSFAAYPSANIATLPSTELLPTLISGVYPHEHGVWQVKLLPQARGGAERRPLDRLPDLLTTSAQCIRLFFDPSFDLAAIPPRRRRQFEQYRFKYTRRQSAAEEIERIGRFDSLFGILGRDSRYRFTKSFKALDALLDELPSDGPVFEFLEMYALDLLQHWNLDRPATMQRAYRTTDSFIEALHERCRSRGVALMLLVDHGQERVRGAIPLLRELRRAGVPEREYSYFVEVAQARFWFHTERARSRLGEVLRALEHCRALDYRELHEFKVGFADDAYGELYVVADPGYIFFPHDFYQPLANTFMALVDSHQRRRLLRPRHRGTHGYLPQHPSEQGYVVLFDEGFRAVRPTIELIDFAPSVLALVERERPDHMKGCVAFQR